jgi:hypothetical protein
LTQVKEDVLGMIEVGEDFVQEDDTKEGLDLV